MAVKIPGTLAVAGLLLSCALGVGAQGFGGGPMTPPRDELSQAARETIMAEIELNRTRLISEGKLSPVHAKTITSFAWPLRMAAGRTDLGYFGISNYVDQNSLFPNQVRDYNCGTRSYDLASGYNHQGTDIFNWPLSWKKMDDEDVVIVAGAPGTIVNRTDGNFDRSCAISSANWNAVYVQHADGSTVWYGHMKSGSLTVKAIGETVVAGEYLGVVGSSGSSSGPHLHLELYDSGNNLIDPWLGACNAKSKQVTWQQQRAYRDPGVNLLTVGTAAPILPTCPGVETSFATDFVTGGSTVYFTTYLRDQSAGNPVFIRILRPDGTVYSSQKSGDGTYDGSYWYWFFSGFPSTAGMWTFEATMSGRTVTKTFSVGAAALGAATQISTLAGSAQSTTPGAMFAAPIRVRVLDPQARPIQGAKVSFTVPPSTGATAILESKTALTDAAGTASVSALANAKAGSYSISASVTGAATPATIALQNATAVALTRSSAAIDFGAQSMKTTTPTQTVAFTNASGAALTVTSITASAHYAVSHNCGALAINATCSASVTFTPGDEGALPGVIGIQTSAGVQSVALAGIGERSLVGHYYRAILRRAADSGGKSYWDSEAARVQALGVNVNEVWFALAGSFFSSAEYVSQNRDSTGYVTDLYNTFFNRAPDAGGLDYWKGLLDQGMPRDVVLSSFMFSPEFAVFTEAIFGRASTRKEIDTVVDFYRGLLGRVADDGGFAFWLAKFRTAQCSGAAAVTVQVESISSQFATGGEYAGRNRTNAQYVGDLYNAFLRRGGDLAGVQFWIAEIASGRRTREKVRQDFVATPEFSARVATVISQGCFQ